LELNQILERKIEMANQYSNLGNLYYTAGDLQRAEKMFLGSLEMNQTLGRQEEIANQYGNLGHLYRKRGDLQPAKDNYLKSLGIFSELGNPNTRRVQQFLEQL